VLYPAELWALSARPVTYPGRALCQQRLCGRRAVEKGLSARGSGQGRKKVRGGASDLTPLPCPEGARECPAGGWLFQVSEMPRTLTAELRWHAECSWCRYLCRAAPRSALRLLGSWLCLSASDDGLRARPANSPAGRDGLPATTNAFSCLPRSSLLACSGSSFGFAHSLGGSSTARSFGARRRSFVASGRVDRPHLVRLAPCVPP
jgi:hypothetical protein